jgi:hypothetical protein
MARATIGESGQDKAMNRMIKSMERSDRRGNTTPKSQTLLEQIQAAYPDTWKEELKEMKREHDDPEYLARKKAAKATFKDEFWKIGRVERENMQISEHVFIARKMLVWVNQNK